MDIKRFSANFTGLAVALALSLGLSLGAFVVLPTPEAAAIYNYDCTGPQPGDLFLHETGQTGNGFGSLCYRNEGIETGTQIYNKDYAFNYGPLHGTVCHQSGTCDYVAPGIYRIMDRTDMITSVSNAD